MVNPLIMQPSKIVAVHLNYASRAAQRGRIPDFPSYFLKPPSSLSGDGTPVVRPRGCELLTFEGEIALVIGEWTRRVPRERAWSRVRWVTAANDLGVYDLRYADRGSNVRSKGSDGFTPVGPRLLDARELDPAALRLRTWVNGQVVQDASMDELCFGFDLLVADLSRLMTLEPGDVILTGTPAGSSVVRPGDLVEVEVSAGAMCTGRLRTPVLDDEVELDPIGAMPRADAEARIAAFGPAAAPFAAPAIAKDVLDTLRRVSTATLSSQLRKRGLQGVTLDGLRPTRPELRLVGVAQTLRYLPLREDLFPARATGMNAQKRAVEEIQPGEVLVIEARGEPHAGTIGDILALRAARRGAAGIVTDGAVRDSAAIAELDLPVYCAAAHPAVLGRRHVPWEIGVPIACAGALVAPGDLLVGDADGVLVVPPALAADVAADAAEQERQERFIAEQVAAGESIVGLYPIGPAWQAAYEQWCGREAGS
ncbi:fumarylacetoacetate hydrolase family protein [Frankia sp. Cr1]|uniref:fumarylacetoacetate hydrolase family protein n=1 Tax=Frankia sp. Cr1 TaxID=3073931 RepID=UPI002AD4273A|nr:fumarylacetoacetate hydrolase family protein [Frankia sp. Cr1]